VPSVNRTAGIYFNVSLIIKSGSDCLSAIFTNEIPASDCTKVALLLSRKYLAEVTC